MIVVVFSGNVTRKPSQDDFGSREPYKSDNLFKGVSVSPGFERSQHVLARCVRRAEEPNVEYPKRCERSSRLYLPHRPKRCGLLISSCVTATIAARAVNNC